MSQDLSISVGDVSHVPLAFAKKGLPLAAMPGGAVASSDDAVATVTLADNGSFATVTAVSVGSTNISYTNGALGASLTVHVSEPVPDAVDFDTPSATAA